MGDNFLKLTIYHITALKKNQHITHGEPKLYLIGCI